MKRLIPAIIIVVIIVAAIAVIATKKNGNNSSNTSDNNSAKTSQSASSNTNTADRIQIVNMLFTPSQITIQKGQAVTWTNDDNVTHTVVDDLSNVGGPHSGDIAPGSSYTFTFNRTGSFQYHCTIHPSMRGTIVVQ